MNIEYEATFINIDKDNVRKNQKDVNQIEIEFRALLTKKKHKELEDFLNKNAKDLGQDDKNAFFFILADKLLKVVDNLSQKTAQIVLKTSRIGDGSDFGEIEFCIEPNQVDKAVSMFTALGFTEVIESFQTRRNYLYKGVELALKHSDHWGYHLELEIVIPDLNKKKAAEKKISKIAKELEVELMSELELREFIKKFQTEYKKNENN